VISQQVRIGREDDYQRWQEKTTEAASGFAGFEGTEVYPPSSSEEHAWVVVFRFSTINQLTTWLQSGARRRLLDEGRGLFDSPPIQEVLAGEPPPKQDVVTAVISHDVQSGREQDFERWQGRMGKEQEKFPGFMGFELFKPVRGVQDRWVAMFRFDTAEHLEEWFESDTRTKLMEEGRDYLHTYDVHKIRSPFSGWFRFDSGTGSGVPPNWKQAMTVVLALYPTVMILNLTVGDWMKAAHIPGYLALFIGNVLSVCALTWVIMPLVNRALTFWLAPDRVTPRLTNLTGVAVVVLCYAVFIAIFGLTVG
jgi:antibiotic biosynthesis monooxygenase (ABM) superfamily enzyme